MNFLDAKRAGWSVGVALLLATGCTPADTSEDSLVSGGTTPTNSGTTSTTTSSSTDDTSDEETTGDGDGDDTTTTTSTTGADAFCGDSIVEGFEQCDCGADSDCTPAELDDRGCEDVIHEKSGNNYDGGMLWCNLNCQFNTTGCYVCGDGVKEEFEPCDGEEFGDNTCGTEGFLGGEIACSSTCELDTSACTEANWSDDFETGDFSGGNYSFVGNGWTVTQDESASGNNAASSNAITANQATEMSLTVDFASAGTIAFNHKEGSESCCDHLTFYIDSTQMMQWGGLNMWAEASFPVTAGTHTFRWVYDKDGSVDTAPDKAWVDDIRTDGTPQ